MFLFDGQAMLDGTPPARALLAASPVRGGEWARLLAYLAPRFAGVEQKLAGLPQDGQISLVGDDASAALMLNADYGGGLLRIALSQGSDPAGRDRMDGLAQKAASEEVAMLRRITDTVPCPIWQETAAVRWSGPIRPICRRGLQHRTTGRFRAGRCRSCSRPIPSAAAPVGAKAMSAPAATR